MIEYKGYKATVEYDAEAGILYGRVIGLRDVVDFQADTLENIEQEFHASVDDYLEFCAQRDEEPDYPYSGKLLFRTDESTHRAIAEAAQLEGISINAWLEQAAMQQFDHHA